LFLGGVTAELDEFFTHREAGNTEPASRFGLITLSHFDGASEKGLFRRLQQAGMGIVKFAALGGREQVIDVFGERLISISACGTVAG
jgi:hypothetical protein